MRHDTVVELPEIAVMFVAGDREKPIGEQAPAAFRELEAKLESLRGRRRSDCPQASAHPARLLGWRRQGALTTFDIVFRAADRNAPVPRRTDPKMAEPMIARRPGA